MSGPRLAPATRRDVGTRVWVLARLAGRVTGTEPPGVFLALGRTRGLFWGWLHFAGRLMPGGRLPRRDTELVILRVAAVRRSAYERAQHERLARRAGLTSDEITAVAASDPLAGEPGQRWSARQRLLLEATDELLETDDLGDTTWSAVQAELGDRCAVELVLLVTHYRMLATTLATLRVPVDRRR
ncbi:carboxymuconolactone decarboxylase family protein [Nocardioides zeae]|uniref:Carboxymuconolactone decarboxylase family protein n=1 Tax=Nocardioides imazamoxiresistens TaxID=3231893 RepID=A0ABU3PU77_9ACTN|nr:carboxymuconolactone decarboxylase family protein [Nocardioides zeae]MDT9592476.1 carboxymuconolactone decarboxylase family protein [Nocardioides zeae]